MLRETIAEKRAIVPLGLIAVGVCSLVFMLEHKCKTNVAVKELRDYKAIYVDNSTLFLIEKRPYHGMLRLAEEEVNQVCKFVNHCVTCSSPSCQFPEGDISVRLSVNTSVRLNIYNFEKCKLPRECFWYGRKFDCGDLLTITTMISV